MRTPIPVLLAVLLTATAAVAGCSQKTQDAANATAQSAREDAASAAQRAAEKSAEGVAVVASKAATGAAVVASDAAHAVGNAANDIHARVAERRTPGAAAPVATVTVTATPQP